ncbi:MAG: hypothetical protein VW713_08465 [Alphaproteobacteria bacterium]
MPTMNHLLIILFLLVLGATGRADKPGGMSARLDIDSKAYKTELIDDDTVVMKNSPQVWLVGITGQKLPLGRPNFKNGHSRTPENRHLRAWYSATPSTWDLEGYRPTAPTGCSRICSGRTEPRCMDSCRKRHSARALGQILLNFGDNRRIDFNISIAPSGEEKVRG